MKLLSLFFLFISSARAVNITNFPLDVQKEINRSIPNLGKKKLRGAEIDQIIKILMRTGKYADVSIMEFKGRYKIKTARIRKILEINISGNEFIGDYQLLSASKLKQGEAHDPRTIIEAGNNIKEYMADQGYLKSKVEVSVKNSSVSSVIINIVALEGPLTQVHEIIFSTPNESLKKALKTLTENHIDGALTKSRTNELVIQIENYLLKNLYYTTQISSQKMDFNTDKTNATLTFNLTDPYKYQFIFLGNPNYSDIRSDIDISSIASSQSNMVSEIKSRVKSRYLKRGYARIVVKTDLREVRKSFRRTLRILIKEGPRVSIDAIEVSGRYLKPPDYYSDFILENSSELVSDGYYNKSDINSGYRSLEAHLQNLGYLQAKIQSSSLHYSKSKDSVSIRVNLIEGPLTRLQSIEFSGVKQIPQQKLFELLNLNPGSALRLNELEDGIARIRQHYLDKGYLEMHYLKEKKDFINYNKDNTLARLRIDIYEGPQIIVQSIIVRGTEQTKDYVVLMELEFEPGDVLTPELIRESRFRLQQTGLFASIQIDTDSKNTMISRRTLIVTVTERAPGLFNLGGGGDNQFGGTMRMYIGATYRNLRRRAHVASIRGELDRVIQSTDDFYDFRLVLGYKYPYLIGTRMSGHINLERKADRQLVDKTLYDESTVATLSLQQDLTSDIKLVFNVFNLEDTKTRDTESRSTKQDTSFSIRSIGPHIEIDKRDSLTHTKKGWYSTMTIEYGDDSFGSNSPSFLRTSNVFNKYNNIYRDWVWKNSFSFSYLKNLKEGSSVPYSRRGIFLGGQSSIRGFQASERFPSAGNLGTDKIENFGLKTDARSYLFSSEIRFPLPWEYVGGAIFYDGGIVQIGDLDNKMQWCAGHGSGNCERPWRHSAGFAARYLTSIGAVSAGVGFKLDRQERLINKPANNSGDGTINSSYSKESEWAIFFSFSTL